MQQTSAPETGWRWNMRAIILASMGILLSATSALADAPVATTDGESPGVSLQIQEFKVSNGTVMLKFSVANDAAASFPIWNLKDTSVAKGDANAVSGIYLIDVANKKKYFVVVDNDGHCVCSRDVADLPSKAKVNLWAKFPAPPDSVKKIGVVVPHFVPMDDVPLSH
jgi:hypothetical protein